MKATEAKVVEGLRKSTLAYLSEKEYAEIVDAIEKRGLLGLTGAASRIVKRTVIKHGSHDQKTHGRGGKGGGGGGGSSSPKTKQQDMDDAKEELSNNIIEAEKILSNAKDKNAADLAKGTVAGFKDVKNALGDKKKMDKVRVKRNLKAAKMMSGSLAPLQEGYRENVGYVNAVTNALAQFGDL